MEVIDPKERPAAGKDIRPAIQLIDDAGEEVELPGGGAAIFFLPANALVTMANGANVELGDVVARIPQESSKTRDITGRSEERRVGKECRSRWSQYDCKKKK